MCSLRGRNVVVAQSPNPSWKPGDGAPENPKYSRMVTVKPGEMPGGCGCYALMVSSFVPRPIALVSTISNDGIVNLAPFSYSGVMSHDPPCICFSICRKRDAYEVSISPKSVQPTMHCEDFELLRDAQGTPASTFFCAFFFSIQLGLVIHPCSLRRVEKGHPREHRSKRRDGRTRHE
eukprot:5474254-Pyramimonas_sp.AAC.1